MQSHFHGHFVTASPLTTGWSRSLGVTSPSPLIGIEGCPSCVPAPCRWLTERAALCHWLVEMPRWRRRDKEKATFLAAPLHATPSANTFLSPGSLQGWAAAAMRTAGSHLGTSFLFLVCFYLVGGILWEIMASTIFYSSCRNCCFSVSMKITKAQFKPVPNHSSMNVLQSKGMDGSHTALPGVWVGCWGSCCFPGAQEETWKPVELWF